MNRLSRTIDAAVGKQAGMLSAVLIFIIGVAPIGIRLGTVVVLRRIGIDLCGHASFLVMVDGLALAVGSQRLRLHGFFPPAQTYRGSADGLSRSGIDHHIADSFVGLWLGDGTNVGHEIEIAHHTGLGLCRELQQIDTHRQSAELQRVGKQLVVLMSGKRQFTALVCQLRHVDFQFPIVLVILRGQLRVTLQLGTEHTQGQRLQMAHSGQFYRLALPTGHHPMGHLGLKTGFRQFGPTVTQAVGTLPRAPALQRLLQPLGILSFIIRVVVHPFITLNGYLAGLRQVAIHSNE